MNPAHKALRAGTAAAHERVDAAFAAFDLTDRESYAAFLRAHAEVLLPLEAALDAAGAERIAPDWQARKRGHLLKEDLALLPLRRPGESRDLTPQGHPAAARDPGLAQDDESGSGTWDGIAWDDAAIAGGLYVVEGSRLGGRFLARQLAGGFPRAYLDADQAPEKWRNLLDRLDSILYEPAQLQSALVAAQRVFAAFERAALNWAKG